jgi:hypothetical protein
MKKLVLTTVCALAMAGAAFAQGTINWGSITAAAMTSQTNATTISPFFGGGAAASGGTIGGPVGNSMFYELLFSAYTGVQAAVPTTLAALSSWQDSGLSATNQTTAGRLSPIAGSTAVIVPWAAGTTDSIVLVGWSANLGTTWTAASANLNNNNALAGIAGNIFFGVSHTGFINAAPGNPGAVPFGTAATASGLPINSLNTQLFLVQVPEPTTIALAGLGGLSVLLFRRRKS